MNLRPTALILGLALAAASLPQSALAWGAKGHTIINQLAAQTLPASLPDFVRSAAAVREIATLGPEEDRIKGAGASWDADNDPGHYLDVRAGEAGDVPLNALPPNMEAYAAALARTGSNPYRTGFLPYSIEDGFERVRKDFAIWRVDDYLARHAATAGARAAFAADQRLREDLTLRDIGDWGHFVGDGSQPLHVTVHFNGWGRYPNPHRYTQRHIHSYFESDFVDRYARASSVRARMTAYAIAAPDRALTQSEIGRMVGAYLLQTSKAVDPLYALYAAGAFQHGSHNAVAFTDAQLAHGASTLRDLIALAWENSLYESVDYSEVPVRDVLSGKVVPPSPE